MHITYLVCFVKCGAPACVSAVAGLKPQLFELIVVEHYRMKSGRGEAPVDRRCGDVATRFDAYIDTAMLRPVGIAWDGTTRIVML